MYVRAGGHGSVKCVENKPVVIAISYDIGNDAPVI